MSPVSANEATSGEVDPCTVKTMKRRPALVAMHRDRQAIDIQGQLPRPFAMLQRGQTPDHESQQAFVHGIDVAVAPEAGQQTRQRG